ncbi:MAG: hypothetical protein V1703_03810 [Candidatus Altiarchaeota archaeon]
MAKCNGDGFDWNVRIIAVLILFSVLNWFLFKSFEIRAYYAVIPALLGLQLFFSKIVEYLLLSKVGSTRWFALLVLPGTILHEISHAAAALITGCKITSLSLFSFNLKTGVLGSVNYVSKKSKVSFIRDLLITFSPFFGCGMAMVVLSKYLFQNPVGIDLHQMGIQDVIYQLVESLRLIVSQYSQIGLSNLLKDVALYLQLCFAFGAAPSSFDFDGLLTFARRNVFGLLLTIFILLSLAILVQYPLPFGMAMLSLASY